MKTCQISVTYSSPTITDSSYITTSFILVFRVSGGIRNTCRSIRNWNLNWITPTTSECVSTPQLAWLIQTVIITSERYQITLKKDFRQTRATPNITGHLFNGCEMFQNIRTSVKKQDLLKYPDFQMPIGLKIVRNKREQRERVTS